MSSSSTLLLLYVLIGVTVNLVRCSFESSFTFCHENSDCNSKPHQVCFLGICDCVDGAIKLSDHQCIAGEGIVPQSEKAKGMEDASSSNQNKTPRDYIPDWALYLSVFFGFMGMVLIAISASSRRGTARSNTLQMENRNLRIDEENVGAASGGPGVSRHSHTTGGTLHPVAVESV